MKPADCVDVPDKSFTQENNPIRRKVFKITSPYTYHTGTCIFTENSVDCESIFLFLIYLRMKFIAVLCGRVIHWLYTTIY